MSFLSVCIGIIIGAVLTWLLVKLGIIPMPPSVQYSMKASNPANLTAADRYESNLKLQFTLNPPNPDEFVVKAIPYRIADYPDGPPHWNEQEEVFEDNTSPQCIMTGSDETHVVLYAMHLPSAAVTMPITDVSSDPCQEEPTC